MGQKNTELTQYRNKTFPDKTKHWGRGYVSEVWRPRKPSVKQQSGYIKRYRTQYQAVANAWRIEWSSGERSTVTPGKILYRSITVWGTYAEARKLLDLIVEKPYATLEEAGEIIEPYIEWVLPPNTGKRKRVIKGEIPDTSLTPQAIKRYFIERDYWRMRLLDTIELYRRFDDD